MIRGTTPVLEFTLPFSTSTLAEAYISFAQRKEIIFEKTLSDCTCDSDTLTLKLTQAETLSLKENRSTEIQIRAKTIDGDALASDIICVDTDRILKDGEI